MAGGVRDPFQYNIIEVPTVLGLLKNILTQYPDNGQIVKELIQNAEDAEASRVELVHDTRTLEYPKVRDDIDIQRFVKGPGLCLYNDAVFSEEDWLGIRRLSDSIKKDDPLRVGQFGLGFKSVFHLTDYITIISGSCVLFMDPSEPEAKMCRLLNLGGLSEVLQVSAAQELWGNYLTTHHITAGHFPGTLFWFPLRQKASNLSSTVYSWNHVSQLFESFSVEAPVCLTFLKSLEQVSIRRVTGHSTEPVVVHHVELKGSTLPAARRERHALRQNLRACGGSPNQTVTSSYNITICNTKGTEKTEQTMLVMHLLPGQRDSFGVNHGGNEPHRHMALVGVAAPMSIQGTRGHLFTFLPLPMDSANATDLPIQVNANFTLDQNRRHVKWRTDESAREPDVIWNEELVSKVVMEAYHRLLVQVHNQAVQQRCDPTIWYALLPSLCATNRRWNNLAKEVWTRILTLPILHSHVGGFQKTSEVITDESLNSYSSEVSKCIRELLLFLWKPLATLPDPVAASLQILNSSPPTVTPQLVRDSIRSSGNVGSADRETLLDYVTSDANYHHNLQGLPLLPLNDGSWGTFSSNGTPVYTCTVDQAGALWGLEGCILRSTLTPSLFARLQTAATTGRTQLVQFDAQLHGVDLLSRSVGNIQQSRPSPQQLQSWLQQVWSLLQQLHLTSVNHLNLLPSCSFPFPSTSLLPLSSPILVENPRGQRLPGGAAEALSLLGVTVIPQPPDYVRHYQLHSYLLPADSRGASQALAKVLLTQSPNNLAYNFNASRTEAQGNALVKLIDLHDLQPDVKNLLMKLNLFKSVGKDRLTRDACVENVQNISPQLTDFPVTFPQALLNPQTTKHQQLAQQLGAKLLSKEELSLLGLSSRPCDQVQKLALYIISDCWLVERPNIFHQLQVLKYVPNVNGSLHQPCELYNPQDPNVDALIGEDLTPSSRFSQHLPILLKLGLRKVVDLPQQMLVRAISNVKASSLSLQERINKSTALLRVLEQRTDCAAVCNTVRNLPFVYGVSDKPSHYLENLPWATTPNLLTPAALKDFNKYKYILGSVTELVECSHIPKVMNSFGWNQDPDIVSFIKHFKNVLAVNLLSSDGFKMVKKIYRYFSEAMKTNATQNLKALSQVPCVFTEDGFKCPDQIFLQPSPDNLQLSPYMHPLPYELWEFASLFQFWGAYTNQSVELYLRLVKQIQDHHSNGARGNVDHDLNIVVSVLEKIANSTEDIPSSSILLPVENYDCLELVEMDQCSYSDQNCDWLNCEELGVRVVHKRVSPALAERLGVKQLSEHLSAGGEAVMEWGQREPLTTRINSLLLQYRDGVAVMKELVQNADDAGATSVAFLYDERQNDDAKTRLLSQQMEQWQGPALWAYNDSSFTENDFTNLRDLGAGTKAFEPTKIGKFGLGFCSVYNLTDVPSFVSGSSFVVFDPHLAYLGHENKTPGLRYNFKKAINSQMLKKLEGQFKPFHHIFECRIQEDDEFNGTLFRFPLRTSAQANTSKISKLAYGKTDMIQLLKMFQKVIGELLLYTQNVKEIKVYHLASNAASPKDKSLLFESSRVPKAGLKSCQESPVKTINALFERSSSFKWNRKVYGNTELSDISVENHVAGKELCGEKKGVWTVTWISSWHSGKGKLCQLAEAGKTLPLGAVSAPVIHCNDGWKVRNLSDLPLGFYSESHLHCFLPLPVKTPLPVQINGFFDVASDRTAVLSKTSDDRQDLSWNTVVMADAVTMAYHQLLTTLSSLGLSIETPYYALWPTNSDRNDNLIKTLTNSFYSSIVSDHLKVFRSSHNWHSLSQCLYLENSFHNQKVIGKIAFEYMENMLSSSSDRYMIELPMKIKSGFETTVISQFCISQDSFYQSYFLPNMSRNVVKPELRDKLTMHILDKNLSPTCLTKVACIPTRPNGKLKAPEELIDPKSSVARLYTEEDEKFPVEGFLSTKQRQRTLLDLGMKSDHIPAGWVHERAASVAQLPCHECALIRSREILRYIEAEGDAEQNAIAAEVVSDSFLPIMNKPNDWHYEWEGEQIPATQSIWCKKHAHHQSPVKFTAPTKLCIPEFKCLIGSSHLILDHLQITDPKKPPVLVLKKLGAVVNQLNLPVKFVIHQLQIFTRATEIDDNVIHGSHSIYKLLEKLLKQNNPSITAHIGELRNENILLTKYGFVKPELFALSSDCADCAPDLFSAVTEGLSKYKNFLRALGIKSNFTYNVVIGALLSKKETYGMEELSDKEIKQMSKLLEELFKVKETDPENSQLAALYLPNSKDCLCPIGNLCLDDGASLSSGRFLCLHRSIKMSPEMLEWLGIKSKTRKRLEESSNRLHFGQSEPLTTRLKNILQDYPCDLSIMKELLQNADDSGATKIAFVKDFRNLPTGKLFDKTWSPLQGPALSVYNNKGFTATDLESIQNLGNSSKKEDPASTGQYGIGFNAVYHLTDAPSFLTKGPEVPHGETLCMFDPHCRYDPDATKVEPGIQMVNLEDLRVDHPDSFLGYLEGKNELMHGEQEGTLFRLPLRTSQNSEISDNVLTRQALVAMLNEFKGEMNKSILFLRNICEISIYEVSELGKMTQEYVVRSTVSRNSELLSNSMLGKKRSSMDCKNLFSLAMTWETYTVTVRDSLKKESTWLVVQQLGAVNKDSAPEIVKDAFHHASLSLLPHAGVALLLKPSMYNMDNHITTSCYLPLPITSGLPFSVNGHFTLSSTRRDLWNGKGDAKAVWNQWLMKEVLVPAAVHALDILRYDILPDNEDGPVLMNEWKYKAQMSVFHKYLPDMKHATSPLWKEFIKWFYEYVRDNQLLFFDVFTPYSDEPSEPHRDQMAASYSRPIEPRNGRFQWHAYRESDHKYPVYFPSSTIPLNILDTLRRLGMKVSSSDMYHYLHSADPKYEYPSLTPVSILEFLHSCHGDDPDNCKPRLMSQVKDTPFLKADNVRDTLEYVSQDESFKDRITNIPLLLTNDNVLRCFNETDPVFISVHLLLLPKLREEFVHACLVYGIFKHIQVYAKAKVIKEFNMEDLQSHLPSVLDASYHCSDDDVLVQESTYLPNERWITNVWKFIVSVIEKKFVIARELKQVINWEAAKKYLLETMGNWSLYPVSKIGKLHLVSINNAWRTLDTHGFKSTGTSISIFQKLPILKPWKQIGVPTEMKLAATYDNPRGVLEILYYYRGAIASYLSCPSTYVHPVRDEANATEILEYLGSFCKQHSLSQDQISALEIFKDVTGQYCCLTSKKLIVPKYNHLDLVPLKQFADYNNFIIMEQEASERIRRLLGYIDPEYLSEDLDIYAKFILPNLGSLNVKQRVSQMKTLKHLLGDVLYEEENKWSPSQLLVVSEMRRTKFVDVGGSLVTADKLYENDNPVFSVMNVCNVPQEWCGADWRDFLKLAGMVHEVKPDMFLRFISSLEANDSEVRRKSTVLVQHLERHFTELTNVLAQIKATKFLVPDKLKNIGSLEDLLPPYKTPSGLVSYSNGVLSEYSYVLWSTASLLPKYASTAKLIKILNISNTVPEDEVLQHITNLCQTLAGEEDLPDEVADVMEVTYGHLTSNESVCDALKETQVPLIHIPDHGTFVSASVVVQSLEEEIYPYLYRAPSRYGKYFKVFSKLGMEMKATCESYALVLQRLHYASQKQPLNPEETKCMTMALNGLLKHELHLKNLCIDVLYLPTRDGTLCESSRMLVADNEGLLLVTQDKLQEPVFVGFAALKINKDNVDFVKRLPGKLRPKFLSEVVQEKLVSDGVEEVTSPQVDHLKEVLGSDCFASAIIRVVNHSKVKDGVGLSEAEIQQITDKIKQVSVKQLKKVEVVQMFKGTRIGSKQKPYHHVSRDGGSDVPTLYLSENVSSSTISTAMSQMFQRVLSIVDAEAMGSLGIIFNNISKPHDIHRHLDDAGINDYGGLNLGCKMFCTDVGSYLEERFLHLLDNKFCQFHEEEIVCMKKYVEDNDENESTFIIVQVIRQVSKVTECKMMNTYEVNMDKEEEGFEIVKAHQLYRFVRKTVNALVVFNQSEEETSVEDREHVSEEEIRRRIRQEVREIWGVQDEREKRHLLRRLFLQWHPDKNPDRVELCTRLFQYIQSLVGRLERGETIPDEEEMTNNPAPGPSHSYERTFRPPHHHFTSSRGTFGGASDRYASGTSGSFHRGSSGARRRMADFPEARKWWRHAEHDLETAQSLQAPASWIMYVAHQAAEKFVKASLYTVDRDASFQWKGESLSQLCARLRVDHPDIAATASGLVAEVEAREGAYGRLRYPTLTSCPCDLFDQEDADFVLEKVSRLKDTLAPIVQT